MPQDKVKVSCSILGQSFTLSCDPKSKGDLEKAISVLQTEAAQLLKHNPNLSPQQAAILTALKALTEKSAIEAGSSPFLEAVDERLSRMERLVKKGLK